MRKSRVFIFIAAVLITLLMSVACDNAPVFEPKENGLVRAYVNIGDNATKDLVITNADSSISKYIVALVPEWDQLENGTPIYGQIGSIGEDGRIKNGKTYTASEVSSLDLGFVTAGKWKIYVEAFNSDDILVRTGNCSVFFVNNDVNATVFLEPVSVGNGTIDIEIKVQELSINDHQSNYKLFYSLEGNNTGVYSVVEGSETVTEFEVGFSSSASHYVTYKTDVNVTQDSYIIRFILKELNTSTGTWNVVGGITRSVVVVADKTSEIKGNVTPSEFVPVELTIPAPSIKVSMSNAPESTVVKGSSISFTCLDNSGNVSEYNRQFFWYINGEKITETDYSVNGSNNTSTFTYSTDSSDNKYFPDYGRYEVRCEVVYYSDSISYIGGASSSFQIVP